MQVRSVRAAACRAFGHRLLVIFLAVMAIGVAVASPSPAHADAGGGLGAPHSVVVSEEPAPWTPWVRDGSVETITQVGNIMVVGGDFSTVSPARSEDTATRTSILAFDASTGAILPEFAPVLDGPVYSLAPGPRPGTVYVGGGFSTLNGAARKSLALLELSTGALSSGWRSPYINGVVRDLSLVSGRLVVGGTFTTVGNQNLGGLASFNPTTGVWDPWMAVRLEQNHNWTPSSTGAKAPVGVEDFDLSDDGRTLVVVGNFRTAGGLPRDQIALLDMTGATSTVRTDWATTRFSSACSTRAFDSWVRDVDIAPDGTYFVVATTGGPHPGTLCDTGSRWELGVVSPDAAPTWTSESGGDTLLSVAATGAAVYIGGHQRWMNNPDGRDGARSGAVPRPGLVGLDPQSGIPVSWNPGRNPRGVGAGALLATSAGLWIGSDTEYIGNFQHRRPRIAFFPVEISQLVRGGRGWRGRGRRVRRGGRGLAGSVSVLGRHVLGQRRVRRAVGHVVAVAAGQQLHRLIGDGRVLERLERLARGAAAAAAGLGLRQQLDRLLQRHVERRHLARQRARLAAALDVRPELAVEGDDRLFRLRMLAERPRQREQLERDFERHVARLHARQQRRVLRLLVLVAGAHLHVGPKAALLQIDRLVRIGMNAQRLVADARLLEHFQRLGQRQLVGRHVLRDARLPLAVLDERAELADADEDLVADTARSPACPARSGSGRADRSAESSNRAAASGPDAIVLLAEIEVVQVLDLTRTRRG